MRHNMNRTVISVLLASALLFSGCDMFRRMAGRPTAAELDRMRAEMMAEKEAEHQARIDSLRRVEKMLADSLSVLDSLRQMNGTILNPSEMGGLFTTRLEARYYIVVGSFLDRSNAEVFLGEVSASGNPGSRAECGRSEFKFAFPIYGRDGRSHILCRQSG